MEGRQRLSLFNRNPEAVKRHRIIVLPEQRALREVVQINHQPRNLVKDLTVDHLNQEAHNKVAVQEVTVGVITEATLEIATETTPGAAPEPTVEITQEVYLEAIREIQMGIQVEGLAARAHQPVKRIKGRHPHKMVNQVKPEAPLQVRSR